MMPSNGDKAIIIIQKPDGRQIVAHAWVTRFRAEQHGEIHRGSGMVLGGPVNITLEGSTPGFVDYEPTRGPLEQ